LWVGRGCGGRRHVERRGEEITTRRAL